MALGRDVLFAAEGPDGVELWASDGRPSGTRQLADLAVAPHAASPTNLLAIADWISFRVSTTDGEELWRSAGTAESTFQIDTDPCSSISRPDELAVNGFVFFFAWDGCRFQTQLWRADGTSQGTLLLTESMDLDNTRLMRLGNTAFFDVADEMWRSDGTVEGTRKAFDLPAGTLSITGLSTTGDAFYFISTDLTGGQQLWRSDGTSAGTRQLGSGIDFSRLNASFTAVGELVYFLAGDAAVPNGFTGLWVTDGTAGGTRQIWTFGYLDEPLQLLAFRGALYFFAPTPAAELALWTSNGTTSGTSVVREFEPTGTGVLPSATVAGERLFFQAMERATGHELWVSDGSGAGTRLVVDLVNGPGSADPRELIWADGKLFFVAHDGVHGYELWTSDGTSGGTRLVHDVAPGAASSYPQELTVAGNHLYFSADDGLYGRELWVLDLAASTGICAPSSTALCLGGRFRVEVAWEDFDGNVGVGHTVPLTADTGAFWFFGPENVEVILKVLDGRPLNEHHWVFYGALSSVDYALTLTDVQTGRTARYWNPGGQLASVADTTGFGPLGAFSVVERSTSGTPPRARTEWIAAAAAAPCAPGPQRLCLNGGRFAVEATWKDFSGNSGVGQAVALTDDTGWFWFFGADNVEVVLKVLDGRPVNGKHWVFYGALSSVEYTLRVTDTATGRVKTYTNPSGNLASVADTGAF